MAEARTQRRQRTRRERRQRRERDLKPTLFPKLWKIFGGVVLVVSAYVLFFSLPASFSPTLQTVTNLAYPFSTQFTFSNEGYLPALNIRPSCQLNLVRSFINVTLTNVGAVDARKASSFSKVHSKDRLTVPCTF